MKKFLTTSLILFLILFTSLVKNSTKKIEDKIFTVQENLRSLDKEYENIKLEFEYLSSSEKLIKFQDLYFKDELIQKNIEEIKIIDKNLDKLKIKKLKLIDK
tara:strand:+ start:936 stop:1241 length:306 start_codon:yes stop_codon:yes gene_type:complete